MDKNELIEKIKTIDVKKTTEEVLGWLVKNIENYIDNQETIFCLYFPIKKETLEGMDELYKLGSLYLLPEVVENREYIGILDETTKLIKDEIVNNKVLLEELFKKLIYFYEMIGFNSQTGPILQELDGYVQIKGFFYDNVAMTTKVTKHYNKLEKDGTLTKVDKPSEVIKEETVPESFVIEFELKKWPKTNIVSVL